VVAFGSITYIHMYKYVVKMVKMVKMVVKMVALVF
jgi:hypothetical protein